MHSIGYRTRAFYYKSIVVVLVIGTSVSCLDQINLPAPAGTIDALVIQGKLLYGEPSVLRVQVNRLFDFTAGTTLPVNVSLVEVEDDEGVVLRVPEVGLGVYAVTLPSGMPQMDVAFGKSYRLHVVARDGREYVTSFETLYDVPVPESVHLDTIQVDIVNAIGQFVKDDLFLFSISTPIIGPSTGEKSYLKWDIERTYKITDTPISPAIPSKTCYVTENVVGTQLKVVNGNDFNTDFIEEFPLVQSSITFVYAEGLYLNVLQQSLSPGAFEYWNQITQLVERSGNMFESPAGKIVSNFENTSDPTDEVYGYFYATTQDTIRFYVDPTTLGLPLACPPPGGLIAEDGSCAAPICCNCLSVSRSTTTKPNYWTE